MAKPKFKIKHTITKKEWSKTHKDFKSIIDGVHYIMKLTDKGTALVPVKITESVNEVADYKYLTQTILDAKPKYNVYYNSGHNKVNIGGVGYDKGDLVKNFNQKPGSSSKIKNNFYHANQDPQKTKKEVEKLSNGKIKVDIQKGYGGKPMVVYIMKESYKGNMSDFKYEFPNHFENETGNPVKAIKRMAKKGKGYEVRTSTYMSEPEMKKVGDSMGLKLADYQKSSNVAISLYESSVNEAKSITLVTYGGKKTKYSNNDVDGFIRDLDLTAEDLPGLLYRASMKNASVIGTGAKSYNKKKEAILKLLKKIKSHSGDVVIDVDSKNPSFKHDVTFESIEEGMVSPKRGHNYYQLTKDTPIKFISGRSGIGLKVPGVLLHNEYDTIKGKKGAYIIDYFGRHFYVDIKNKFASDIANPKSREQNNDLMKNVEPISMAPEHSDWKKYMKESIEESLGAEIDLIMQNSNNLKDFIKKIFSDSDFKDMKNDKDFIKYLKSIYTEGIRKNESKEPEIITQLRDVVKNGYKTLKDPKTGKKMKVDSYSASAITQVYDIIKNQQQRDKFVNTGLLGMQSISFKVIK